MRVDFVRVGCGNSRIAARDKVNLEIEPIARYAAHT
jgi:hypothetical protein